MSQADHDSRLQFDFTPWSAESNPPARDEIPTLYLDSTGALPAEFEKSGGFPLQTPGRRSTKEEVSGPPVIEGREGLWLSGEVLLCACPDCRAPMTIRLWLMVADCWSCHVSIELTEEQEREAEKLLADRAQVSAGATKNRVATEPVGEPRRPSARERSGAPHRISPAGVPSSRPSPKKRKSRPERKRAADAPSPARKRMHEFSQTGFSLAWLKDFLKDLPAWLISLVLHLVAITILALLTIGEEKADPKITLSLDVSSRVDEGGRIIVVSHEEEVQFDLPLPENFQDLPDAERRAMIRADEIAREIRIDPDALSPELADPSDVRSQIGSSDPRVRMLAARDPRFRVEMVSHEGGTTRTEAAVARALRWMALHQNADGSWSLHNFQSAPRSPGNSGGQGRMQSDMAGTALVLLPYLGAGQTHFTGIYQDEVAMGLRWMIDQQAANGDMRAGSQGNSGMYAQGQAAIVLCEAYAMTGDESLREPAQRAIDFIVDAQNEYGGWRYQPNQPGDTSVLGWQLMALQSAMAANLHVPEATMERAGHFLDSVQGEAGSRYSYMPNTRKFTHPMTAEALLCRIYLGWKGDHPGLTRGTEWLIEEHLPQRSKANIYYWYYGTQVMHHVGGDSWERWNRAMRDILVGTQETNGPAAGSWAPTGGHASTGGRLYMTALATCTLEIYYRHAPIFRRVDLD